MISGVPSVSSVHVELDDRLPSTAGRTDETTKLTRMLSTLDFELGEERSATDLVLVVF